MKKYYWLVFIAPLLLIACSDEQAKDDKSYLLEGQLKAMDKAKNVEKIIQDGFKKRSEAEK